jgi:hypothetical protein
MINSLTFDLEDWFCAHNLRRFTPYESWGSEELRIVESSFVACAERAGVMIPSGEPISIDILVPS